MSAGSPESPFFTPRRFVHEAHPVPHIASLFVLAGCNTVQGVGKDVQKVGEKVEDAAKKK